ncbi:MAG TPA: hypothetical protein VNT30_09345 [Stellaceae bacterium]|nr:hypothetical protein [Stellaceae bacterium]
MSGYVAATNQLAGKAATVYQTAVALTPTDNTQIGPFSAFYVGVTGDVTVVPRDSVTPVLFKAVPAGTLIPMAVQGVNATGTSATNILGLG